MKFESDKRMRVAFIGDVGGGHKGWRLERRVYLGPGIWSGDEVLWFFFGEADPGWKVGDEVFIRVTLGREGKGAAS